MGESELAPPLALISAAGFVMVIGRTPLKTGPAE
jgi:hypothetical protein